MKRYFGEDTSKTLKIVDKTSLSRKNAFSGGETRVLKRAGVTLYEMQCRLNTCGATDLVIDLVMKRPSCPVFLESIKFGISLLEGGNSVIQVRSSYIVSVFQRN